MDHQNNHSIFKAVLDSEQPNRTSDNEPTLNSLLESNEPESWVNEIPVDLYRYSNDDLEITAIGSEFSGYTKSESENSPLFEGITSAPVTLIENTAFDAIPDVDSIDPRPEMSYSFEFAGCHLDDLPSVHDDADVYEGNDWMPQLDLYSNDGFGNLATGSELFRHTESELENLPLVEGDASTSVENNILNENATSPDSNSILLQHETAQGIDIAGCPLYVPDNKDIAMGDDCMAPPSFESVNALGMQNMESDNRSTDDYVEIALYILQQQTEVQSVASFTSGFNQDNKAYINVDGQDTLLQDEPSIHALSKDSEISSERNNPVKVDITGNSGLSSVQGDDDRQPISKTTDESPILLAVDSQGYDERLCELRDNPELVVYVTNIEDVAYPSDMEVQACHEDTGKSSIDEGHTVGKEPFPCNRCEKSFATKARLTSHRRSHKDKTHVCDSCGKAFIREDCLITHIRIHTREKPFACDSCGRGFSERGSLSRHKRIHTGEKPFPCEQCGFKCSQKSSLKRHRQNHLKYPHFCRVCGKFFRDASQRWYHCWSKHNIN